jgi:hypothetical protein
MRQKYPNPPRHVQQVGIVNTMSALRIITKVRTIAVVSLFEIKLYPELG